jgi:DNA-binding transcriptional LysR family regulator
MRKFNTLDPQSLKAFYYAALCGNFTRASEKAGLTQSGVSQHVAHLEAALGVSLFRRVGKRVLLTPEGYELQKYIETYLDDINTLFEKINHLSQKLEGEVRYAMPASCLMTPHFQRILEARRSFDQVRLSVLICHSEEVSQKLLAGEIDFGFVTRAYQHKDIEAREFAQEEYVLVGPFKKTFDPLPLKQLEQVPFVNYPGMDALYDLWLKAQPKSSRLPSFGEINLVGQINDLAAAIQMCIQGVGLGIFPKHCIEKFLKDKKTLPLSRRYPKEYVPHLFNYIERC